MGSNETAEDKFARLMKIERSARGWSQAKLAEEMTKLGVKTYPTTVAKIEQRDSGSPRTIRLNEALALSALLEIPLGDLAGEPDTIKVAYTADKIALAARKALRQVDSAIDDLTRTYESLDTLGYSLSHRADFVNALEDPEAGKKEASVDVHTVQHFLLAEYHRELRKSLSDTAEWVRLMSEVPWMDPDQTLAEFLQLADKYGIDAKLESADDTTEA